MWKNSPWIGPIYQMTRLLATLGLAIAPQLMKPFLGYYYNYAGVNVTVDVNFTVDINATLPPPPDFEGFQPIQMAYIALALVLFGMALVLVLTSSLFSIITGKCTSIGEVLFPSNDEFDDIDVVKPIPDESKAPSKDASEPLKPETQPKKIDPCSRPGRVLVSLIFVAFLMNGGTSVLYVSLMYTYLYEYLRWSVAAATTLCSMYQFARFFVGTVVVFVARFVRPIKLVIFDLSSMFLSSAMMLAALGMENKDALDTLTAIGLMTASLGDSNILPTIISLADESIQVKAPVMSLFIAAGGMSLLITGPMGGYLLNYEVVAYPLSLLTLVSACMMTIAVYSCILHWLKGSKHWQQ